MTHSQYDPSLPPFRPNCRASGILMHVTSLPSPYGIGDVGPAAFSWIDRLHEAGQGGRQLGTLQLDDQLAGGLKPIAWIAGHHPGQDAVEKRRHFWINRVRRNEVAFELLFSDFTRAVSLERHFARQQVV